MTKKTFFSPMAVLAIVIANMVGTGVFTSLGYQLVEIRSGFAILLLWALGGAAALCGAFCYGELGARFPRSGGEYNFLSRTLHPAIGFVAGWVSATVGFAAPAALAAIACSAYLAASFSPLSDPFLQKLIAVGLIVSLAAAHAGRRQGSADTQFWFTALKLAVIVLFCGAVFGLALFGQHQPISFRPQHGVLNTLTSAPYAVALIYVSYAYTGWNAAAYLIGELERPAHDLSRILITGTLIVIVLYIALNAAFLLAAPIEALVGQEEVGVIAALSAFGENAGRLVGLVMASLLVSTVSALTLVGPRVLQMMGEDIALFKALGKTNADKLPARAIWFQTLIACLLIITATFDKILVFSGFALALMSFLTVLGLLKVRFMPAESSAVKPAYTAPLLPLTAGVYLTLTGWTLFHVSAEKPYEAGFALLLMLAGLVVYLLLVRRSDKT